MKIDKNNLTYANEHPKGKKPIEENTKVAKRIRIDNKGLKTLRDYLRQSELPEMNPSDYGKEELIDILIDLDKNMFFDGRKG
tara:strand:+ start:59 stop:304 length:246 start_codon:yes stop_codon:yes gene_type:complete